VAPKATIRAAITGEEFLRSHLKLKPKGSRGQNTRFDYGLNYIKAEHPGLSEIDGEFGDGPKVADQSIIISR
jgi:hypothetical protein